MKQCKNKFGRTKERVKLSYLTTLVIENVCSQIFVFHITSLGSLSAFVLPFNPGGTFHTTILKEPLLEKFL